MRTLTVVAVTHQRAPFAFLERVVLDRDKSETTALAVAALPGVDEAVVLSTCNRTELYLIADPAAVDAAIDLLAANTRASAAELRSAATIFAGDDASLHLFRVAAGLESRIVGEGEVLAQVRATATRAQGHPSSGPALDALFRWAAATGRRVRRAEHSTAPPSLARTAIDAAGPLQAHDMTIVIGSGAMAAALSTELSCRGLRYRVAARRPERATRLTRRTEDAVPLGQLQEELATAALVVCATAAPTTIVTADIVRTARRDVRAPLTIVDLSMPRNVDAAISSIDGVVVHQLEQLTAGAGELHDRRSNDAVRVEHDRFKLWQAGQATGAIIAALRQHVTSLCRAETERCLNPVAAATMTRRIAGKLCHEPTIAIKELAVRGDWAALETIAAVLGVTMSEPAPPQRTKAAS